MLIIERIQVPQPLFFYMKFNFSKKVFIVFFIIFIIAVVLGYISFQYFLTLKELKLAKQSAQVKEERIKIRFPDMLALVKWIKDIGANVLERDIYIGKDWLAKASEYYDQHYRDRFGIYATFEVVWINAKK